MNRIASIGLIIASAIAGCGAALLVPTDKDLHEASGPMALSTKPPPACSVKSMVSGGAAYTRPLVLAGRTCRSTRLAMLGRMLQQEIEQAQASGTVFSASFYLEDLNKAEWFGYGEQQAFMPGSLLKVPVLIAYLRMLDQGTTRLDQGFMLDTREVQLPPVRVRLSRELIDGRVYSVGELLEALVGRSENKALFTLLQHVDQRALELAYSEVGLSVPSGSQSPIPITAEQYSRFWKVLYNSNTMSNGMAAFGLDDAIRSEFVHGIVGGVPAGVLVAHKFGEFEDVSGQQLHDSGIIYMNGSPYLLTVMTKGPDMRKQAQLIRSLSATTHAFMSELGGVAAFVPKDSGASPVQH